MTQSIIDICLELDLAGRYDLTVLNGDLKTTAGLDSAIIISILTDARASESQIQLPQQRRGWPGNVASIVPGRQLGSLLWLTDQRRLTAQTLNAVVDYVHKALSWITEDTLLKTINTSGEIVPLVGIVLKIKMTAHDGTTSNQYVKLWEATGQNANQFSNV